MSDEYETITQFIGRFQVALTNARSNERIAGPLSGFGYDEAKWAEGEAVLAALSAAQSTQQDEFEEKKAATAAVQDALETATQAYSLNRALGKRAFAGDKLALSKLRLDEARPERRLELVEQATHFYNSLLADPDYLAAMGQFGRSAEILSADLEKVTAVPPLHAAQLDETAEAQAATQSRDQAASQARIWLGTLLEVAQFALAHDPQLLEALGIQV